MTDPDTRRREIERMVLRVARETCPPGCCAIEPALEACARDAVARLMATSRVTTYVPVLAVRAVRGCIRAGACEGVPA